MVRRAENNAQARTLAQNFIAYPPTTTRDGCYWEEEGKGHLFLFYPAKKKPRNRFLLHKGNLYVHNGHLATPRTQGDRGTNW